jgi:hypothetical protein
MKKRGEKEKELEKRKRKGGESLWLFFFRFIKDFQIVNEIIYK